MPKTVIACEMLEDEIKLAMQRAGRTYEVVWLERQLHSVPSRLCAEVQRIIDERTQDDTLLLAMAQCGNAFTGLQSRHATLVLPRFADCIRVLRSIEPGSPGEIDIHTLYLTKGWLKGDKAFLNEYRAFAARKGEEMAQKAYRMMMANYSDVCMMDTGAYDLADAEEGGRATADLLGLTYVTDVGTTRVLEKLFSGEWDEEFIVVPPGKTIVQDDFPLAQMAGVI